MVKHLSITLVILLVLNSFLFASVPSLAATAVPKADLDSRTGAPPADPASKLASPVPLVSPAVEPQKAGPLWMDNANTTLSLAILSTPWAVLDHNDPIGLQGEVPNAFVVHAVVTNTGLYTATELLVVLDYDEDPANNWRLLPGEDPERTVDELAPGSVYHAYWFATYSTVIGAGHRYTVTAQALNAPAVSTSRNYYELLAGDTVRTRPYLSTGNSGVSRTSSNIVVGVAFTITVGYDLGSSPHGIIFSPLGNTDFDPEAYRLVSSAVRFYNDSGTQETIVHDRLYFPPGTLPSFAANAEAIYVFLALTPRATRLCPYGSVDYQSTDKYDQFYCSPERGTVIPIEGTLTLELLKTVSEAVIQQGEVLTYSLAYTNTGTLPLSYVWMWDDVGGYGSLLDATIDPPPDANETSPDRVAWYLGTVPPGQAGLLTFALLVDGRGTDLPDGSALVNHGFFGINPGSMAQHPALTSTVTTTLQAPAVSVSKSDGRAAVVPGEALTYALHVSNAGSVAATNLVITDVLPAYITPAAATQPITDSQAGQTLVWSSLGPIPPHGSVDIQVPAAVAWIVPDGTLLTNTLTARYSNPAGHRFEPQHATDTTLVQAPVLSITKTGTPNPVLAGRRITYTLEYVNNGPATATGVLVTDAVPLSTTFVSCGALACAVNGGIVSWAVGSLAGHSSGSVWFSVLVDESLPTHALIRNEDYCLLTDQSEPIFGPPVITLVNRDAAFIDGYAFVDADVDGQRDPGEAGLAGVGMRLPQALDPTQPTDSAGYYRFRVETEGPIVVSADPVPGYFRTTGGSVYLDSVLGVTETVNFGYAPVTSTFGVLYGTVFEDANHDGAQGLGESGLVGVTVGSAQADNSPRQTNTYGQYTLRYLAAGSVTVVETNPPFYVSTTPDTVAANVVLGGSGDSPVDYGDFRGIRIEGRVFNDQNYNGVNDDGAGVGGAVITADGDSTTSDSQGDYLLYVDLADAGPVLIVETDPAGYVSTNAVPGAGMTRVNDNTLRIASPISGTVYSGADFGDVLRDASVLVSGLVWNDNGAGDGGLANGQRDGTEPPLAGALVRLSSGLSQVTGASGQFSMYGPARQAITVTETNPAGYVSTNAVPGGGAVKIDNDTLVVGPLSGGQTSADNQFGDVLETSVAVIAGRVFSDANENGRLDGGEAGLARVQVTLQPQAGIPIVVLTGAGGEYEFAVAPGTPVQLASAGPGGAFYPTTPETVFVQAPAPGYYPDNNFGYSDDPNVAVIYGIVFDDADSDGQQGMGELGLAGATVTLNGGRPIVTVGSGLIAGTFAYAVSSVQIYALHEDNPTGYRSTTPDDLNVPVPFLGRSYYADFGDTDSGATATIYGTVFDDLDTDGRQDTGEPGLAGVVISVTVTGGVRSAITKAYGQYTYGFEVEEAGSHVVREQDPARPGYSSTTPDQVNVEIQLNRSYIVNFGDAVLQDVSIIVGTVFYDSSVDGAQDPAEPGIGGVLISLSNGLTTTTSAEGLYSFAVATSGAVAVIETDPPGFHSTTPNTVTVPVQVPGHVYRVNFGDDDSVLRSSIFGTVFDDQNVNGARDWGELGIAGASVAITDTFAGLPLPVLTNEWGQYTFLIEHTGVYTVTETDRPGYVSTCAIPGSPAVSVVNENELRAVVAALGTDLGDNLYGDILGSAAIVISGAVWDDNGAGSAIAGNGLWEAPEPPLAGASVSLSSGLAQATGPDGSFALYAPPNQAITVYETNPAGYVSTGAVPGANTVLLDADTLLVGALPGGSTSAGHLFGDALTADVSVVKTGEPESVVAGTVMTYTLSYHNAGPAPADGLVLTDTLPTQLVWGGVVSQPPDLSGPVRSGRVLVWTAPLLAPGASGTIVLTGTVRADASGYLLNRADVRAYTPDVETENNSAEVRTPLSAAADLELHKQAEPAAVIAGQNLTYTLLLNNHGPSQAQTVVVTDLLPAQVTLLRATPPPDIRAGQMLSWILGAVESGGLRQITVVVAVDAAAGGWLQNSAAASGATADPDAGNNRATASTWVGAAADLSIVKTGEPDPVLAGETLTYSLQVENLGPSDADDVLLIDTLPAGVTFDPACSSAACSVDGNVVTCDVDSLAVSAVTELLVVVQVGSDLSGDLVNHAEVDSPGVDPNPANNTATATTTVDTWADLALTKTAEPDPVLAGQLLTYTLTVANAGPSDSQPVLVTDTLPGGVTFAPALSSPECAALGQQVVCALQPVAAHAAASAHIVVWVDPGATGSLYNTATTRCATHDPDPGDNMAAVTTQIDVQADLSIAKSDDPDPVLAGGVLTYTLDVANAGPSDATNVRITDTLPAGLAFGGAVSSPFGDPLRAGPQLVWSAPVLAASSASHIVFTVTVGISLSGQIANQATVGSSTADPAPADNQAVENTAVTAAAVIHGTVFDDANGNGHLDTGEAGIEGVLLTLDGAQTATTDADGHYVLTVLAGGLYVLVETDPPNYFSTTPNEVHVPVELGQTYVVNFGDATGSPDWASLYGTVFEDLDGDGLWDAGESGLPDVSITLDGASTAVTDLYGNYSFSTTVAGPHRLVETDPPGYFSTTPNTVTLSVALGHGYQVDYGDAPAGSLFASLYGTVFEDLDSDGQWDGDELGLAGVTITLDGSDHRQTGPYGGYTFSTAVAGSHTLVEADLPGYLSTTPNTVTLDVELGAGYEADFGDVAAVLCTCPPDSYEDDDQWPGSGGLTAGARQSRDFCDDPLDWTSFSAQAGQVYTITTSAWGQRADTYLALYSPDGQTVLAANDDYEGSTDYSSRIAWRAPASGVYYLATSNRAGLYGCLTGYELWLEQSASHFYYLPIVLKSHSVVGGPRASAHPAPQGVIHHDCPDAFEPDDSWEQAPAADLGATQVRSFDSDPVLYAADKDIVWLELARGQTMTVTVGPVTGTVTYLELYNAEGAALDVTGNEQLVWHATNAGRYHVSVSPLLAAFGCSDEVGYQLRVQVTPLRRVFLPLVIRAAARQ